MPKHCSNSLKNKLVILLLRWEVNIQIVKQSQIDRDHDLEKCKEQWKEFQAKWERGENSNNPSHSTCEGNRLAYENKYEEALENYDLAIKQDPVFSIPARYNRTMTKVKQQSREVLT